MDSDARDLRFSWFAVGFISAGLLANLLDGEWIWAGVMALFLLASLMEMRRGHRGARGVHGHG